MIDLTWVWAGPFAAMQLAHLGADVIKIESHGRIDVTRRLGPFVDGEPGIDRSGYFNQFNQGKRSVCLDPTTDDGRALLARLLAGADVVIDNMRAGALARMGFDDARLRELNPRIVAMAMTGYGETGPERDKLAYGSLIDALAGVTAATGPPGGGPTEIPMSLPDPSAGLHAAIGTVAALYRLRTHGIGADMECSMLEAWLAALPWGVLTTSAEERPPELLGTRDELMSPHGTFPAAGDYAWIAIATRDDAEFTALAAAIARPELAADPRFATLAARRANEDELEAIVGGWTATRSRDEAVATLVAAGVTAAPVRTMDEVATSEHLRERGFFVTLEHPEAGTPRRRRSPVARIAPPDATRPPRPDARPAHRRGAARRARHRRRGARRPDRARHRRLTRQLRERAADRLEPEARERLDDLGLVEVLLEHEPHVGEAVDHPRQRRRRVPGIDRGRHDALALHAGDEPHGPLGDAAPHVPAQSPEALVVGGDLLEDGHQPGVLAVVHDEAGDRATDGLDGFELVERVLQLDDLGQQVFGERPEDVLLRLEVEVERPSRHAGALDDPADAGAVEAVLLEHLTGDAEQLVPRLAGAIGEQQVGRHVGQPMPGTFPATGNRG